MKIEGLISSFGGPSDEDMKPDEGLSLYEHGESDLRPDLFVPRGTDDRMATNTRLRTSAYYFACRFDHSIERSLLQTSKWMITNPKTGNSLWASLVDWGPAEWTGRSIDVSPGVMKDLELNTNDLATAENSNL